MNIELSRRSFMLGAGAGLAGTSLGALGFGEIEAAHALSIRPFKLAQTREARGQCPYCAVCCGMMIYSAESKTEKGKMEVTHIEGDVDHPVNRGTLCPKGAGALDYIKSKSRVKYPMYRKPGGTQFERVTWDFAMDRLARLMKDDRDANWIEKNRDGVTVNRWVSTAFLAGSSLANEPGWLTYKVSRGLGLLQIENQARV
ncbi:major subunit of formate dehydrogenase-O [Afipia carboxidovorans OM5]|nr:major subunit of formate dehydrogenase-O [Afipia carboxidovorans OM5]